MNSHNIPRRRWLLSCLFFISLLGCKQNEYKSYSNTAEEDAAAYKRIEIAKLKIGLLLPEIQNGDLITRVGNDYTSQSLRTLNTQDTRYSHVGLASIENDSLFVYHALGGEWNPDEKIKREPLQAFADPTDNNAIGVFRLDLPRVQKAKIISLAKAEYLIGTTFDMRFDLATDDKMYCAEYISKMIERGTHPALHFDIHTLGHVTFIGVDDIFLHAKCKEIVQLQY